MTQQLSDSRSADQRSVADIDDALRAFADGFTHIRRAPVLHPPSEYGLSFESVTFPSRDGVPLEGWFIPAVGSTKLVVANHPRGFSRSGLPADQQPWQADWGRSGNGFEVNLGPDYQLLHDAGYNVLTYDLRNHGLSGAANGGVTTGGVFEQRDVLGSLDYVRSRPDTRDMTIGLFSRCMGAASTFAAMAREPTAFADIRCLVAPEAVTAAYIVRRRLGLLGLEDHLDTFERHVALRASVPLREAWPQDWARSVHLPTLMYAVHDDLLVDPSDTKAMFANIPDPRKELYWIEGTTARFDGYLEFQRRPQRVLDWFAKWMS